MTPLAQAAPPVAHDDVLLVAAGSGVSFDYLVALLLLLCVRGSDTRGQAW